MVSKYPRFIALSLVLMLVISGIAYFVMLTAQNYSPLARMKNAQDVAKMSGEYQFRTDIDQVSGYAPSITNYGRESRHDQLVVEGTISESTQTSTMTISNANGVMLEVRRERGQTYARRPGTGWQRAASNSTAQINTLSYLAGMTNAKVVGSDGNSFDFGFDGNAFATHFARLLSADAAHGIKYSDEWYSIAQSNQFKEANGDGNLTLDSDGLPKNMTLNLTMPGNNNNGTVQTSIKTSFFAYARTGLALKKVLNNPFTLVGNLLGTDTSAVKTVLFSLLAILAVTIIGVLVHLFRRRLYLPVTLLALGMLVFQPFSNIPRSYAATSQGSDPTPVPNSTTPSKPEVTFNPLVSPLQQMGTVVLPSAGTTTANDTVVVGGSQSRSLTTRNASSPVSCATLTDSNKNMDADGDGLTNQDECVTYKTLPNNADSDGDGLSDFAEVQLGTSPTNKDTDLDGLSDYAEVATYTQYPGSTNKFYTDPLKPDTNGDGINDAFECPTHAALSKASVTAFVQDSSTYTTSPKTSVNCADTNNDKIPDFITVDNDGDGVSDSDDSSPFVGNPTVYNEQNPYHLTISNTATTVHPLTVDLQIRPDTNLMYANDAIYDWPSNDTDGQFIRVRNTTFQSSTLFSNQLVNAQDASASNGDIKVTAMLEIKIPITIGTNASSSQYGNLPLTDCGKYTDLSKTLQLNSADSNSCINMEQTKKYGINISWDHDVNNIEIKNSVKVGVPINPNYDANGTIVSYTAQMYYETSKSSIPAHEVRLKWTVSAIKDECPSTNASCTVDQRIEQMKTIQTYYSGFKIVGINATESYGTNVAVIYEDTIKPSVTGTTNRRLALQTAYEYLDTNFVQQSSLTIDGTDTSKSIPVIFDSTKNQSSPITSTVKDATKVKVQTYPTSIDSLTIGNYITNQVLPIVQNGCENVTTVQCRPGMIIASESTERNAYLAKYGDITLEVNKSKIRSIKGIIYKVVNNKWVVTTSQDMASEVIAVKQAINATPVSSNLSPAQRNNLISGYTYALLIQLQLPRVKKYGSMTTPPITATNTYADWSSEFANFYEIHKTNIENLITNQAAEKKTADDIAEAGETTAGLSGAAQQFAFSAIELANDHTPGMLNRSGSAHLLVSALTLSMAFGSHFGTENKDLQNNIEIATGAIESLNSLVEVVEAVKEVKSALTETTYAVAAANELAEAATDATKTTTKVSKALGIIGVVVQIGVAWAIGIMAYKNADYDYQRANAVATMFGQTMAIIFLTALSFVPVVGELIVAIIAFLDSIATLACATLSEAEKRTTTSKWLCGGITGILANLFTPYASNPVIDPDDTWSRYKKIEFVDASLTNPSANFMIGNSLKTTMRVTDYIKRMPFPSSWQAAFWAWQWNELNERSTSSNYVLDTKQKDINDTIKLGDQTNKWITNTTPTPTPSTNPPTPSTNPTPTPSTNECNNSAYFKFIDSEDTTIIKEYDYRKCINIEYTSTFNQSGINTKLPDLYVLQAIKVPQQTCYSIPAPIIIFPLIPICKETLTGKDDNININDGSPTKFDILPATIDDFVSMQPKENGYTFGWSPLDADPPFPVFKDADNDGLSNNQENIYTSSDNAYDTDGDGISDGREVALTTNPVLKDSDNDGLTDDLELQMGTNPLMPDSDGDGLLDGEEVVHVVKDANGNVALAGGWSVTYAIINNVPQTTWTSSDPLNADFDGDHIIDLREKILGWSPYAQNRGEIMTASGTVREALLPAVQVGFDNNNNPKAFSNSGFVASDVQCIYRSMFSTTAITCPTVTTTTDRTLPNSTTMNPYVTLTGIESLDVGNGPQSNFDSQFTIAAWLKPSANNRYIFYRANLLNAIYTSNGAVQVQLTTTKGTYTLTTASGVLPGGSWKHLAVTYGNQVLVVYVDGVEVGRAAVAGNLSTTPTQNLIIGKGYEGGIDDIAVYRVALRAGEITQLKNGTLASSNDLIVKPGDRLVTTITEANKLLGNSIQSYNTINSVSVANGFQESQITTTSLAPNTAKSFDSIVTVPGAQNTNTTPYTYVNSCVYAGNELCVKFDETASNTTAFTDFSPNKSNLTCTNTTCPEYSNGSWRFSGTRALQTTVDVGNAISASDFTIAAWVYPQEDIGWHPIIVNNSSSAQLELALDQNRLSFNIQGNILLTTAQVQKDTWSHVVFTLAAGKRSIYINGELKNTDTTAIAYPGSFGALRIGNSTDTTSLRGRLRDLQIYSNALTRQQITALANSCEDPQLIGCIPLRGSTNDKSTYGTEQGSFLSEVEVSKFGNFTCCSASFPIGYAKLISDHDFTMVAKVNLGSTTANQTIMQTASAIDKGNQFKVATNGSSVTTLSVGELNLTAGSALVAGNTYVITARYQAGLWTLRVDSANGDNLQTTSNSNEGLILRRAQEPLSVGQAGMTINNIRIYRTAVNDSTLAAVARNALFGTLSLALNTPPVSDKMQINVDARGKVIQTDQNFERIRGNCEAAVVCLPFTSWDYSFPSAELKGATATQSTSHPSFPASLALDGNRSTFTHTAVGGTTNPWLEINLGSSKSIRNLVITNRLGCCPERIANAIVFLSKTSLGTSTDIATNKANSVSWKNIGCDDQAPTCTAYKDDMYVRFPADTNAQFIRIQLPRTGTLSVGEIKINQPDVSMCQSNGACPTISNGGANFTKGKHVSISPEISKATFEGDKNFTVMTWVRFNAISGEQAIMYDRSDVNTRNKRLNLGITAGKLYFSYYQNVLNGTTTLQPNTWYHVAFVKNDTYRSIYLNGILEAKDPLPTVAGLISAREMFIGETNDGKSSLNGTLRDFQIHNTVLDVNATGMTADIAKAATTKSFELRIPFDEPAVSSQFSDVLATGLSLSCINITACPLSGLPGRDDRSVHFDGAQGLKFNTNTDQFVDYIHKVDSPNFTISMWVRPNTYDTSLLSSQQFQIGINSDGYLSYEQGRMAPTNKIKWPTDPLLSQQQLPLNTWSHITVSTQSGTEYIYVNGNQTSRTPTQYFAVSTIDNTATVNLAETFVGDIDELRISPIATTDATAALADMKQAPTWNLTFEDGLDNNRYTQDIASDNDIFKPKIINSVTYPIVTQSSGIGAQSIINGTINDSFSTSYDANPWVNIDLGESKNISSLDIYMNHGYDQSQPMTPLIFASNTDFGTRIDIATMKTSLGVVWRNVGCNDMAVFCSSSFSKDSKKTVSFPAGTKARYLRIQQIYYNPLNQVSKINIAEIMPSPAPAITSIVTNNGISLPNNIPGPGINRFKYAASCDMPEFSEIECPIGNTLGQTGSVNLFNGTNTMFKVGNGTDLINEIKDGGTIQMMIKPDKLTGTQTLLHYGDTSGNTAFQVQIVADKVKITFGTNDFTSSTPLSLEWNQISFSFGATGFKYFQNGNEDTNIVTTDLGLYTGYWGVEYGSREYFPKARPRNNANMEIVGINGVTYFQNMLKATSTEDCGKDPSSKPWITIDLGREIDIGKFEITAPTTNDGGNALVFASTSAFEYDVSSADEAGIIPSWKQKTGVTWREYDKTVIFPAGTKARYLRFVSPKIGGTACISQYKPLRSRGNITIPIPPDATYNLRIGGKITGQTRDSAGNLYGGILSEMFQGGIDDITYTPSTMASAKVYRIARSQNTQTVTKTTFDSVTIDTDPPEVRIQNNQYVARLPQQFNIFTSDQTSIVVKATANITSTRNASGAIVTTPIITSIDNVPPCDDAKGGSAYCPTFGLTQNTNVAIEGKYGITTTVYDAVGNVATAQSTVLVDTTPPTATLIRPTGTYRVTQAPNQINPQLTLQLNATDPVLTNSGNSPGSGVKSLVVNLRDSSGQKIINGQSPIPAILENNVWTVTIPMPAGPLSGNYQVGAIVTDNSGNQSNEIMVANSKSMIEVDAAAPYNSIIYPSPYKPDNYFVGQQTINGRVSDLGDGRTALQQYARIRLDYEAPNGQSIENRGDSRYTPSCDICPGIATETSLSSRVARFNIDSGATKQSLTVTNATTILDKTSAFSIAFMAKISDAGTILSTGTANFSRLRIKAIKTGNLFQVAAQKGNSTVNTPATLAANTWYYFIYSEYTEGTTQKISLTYGNTPDALKLTSNFISATFSGQLPPSQPDIIIGAMQSSAGNTAKEDFFRGSIDDVILSSPGQLDGDNLANKATTQGSGIQSHLTRLVIDDDNYTGNDRLTNSVDFYMPMNQSSFPLIDAINGHQSSRCIAGNTIAPTCPVLREGFSSNAVLLQRTTDGIQTDYQLQTSATTAKSMALRFKIGVDATSGLIAWLQAPSSSDSLAMQIGYNNDLQSVTVRINNQSNTLLATNEATTAINDNNWHAMVITSTGSGTNEQVSVYIDGTLVVNKTISGHWINATLGVGTLAGVSGYSGTATDAAINTAIDDLAIFNTALTSANIIDYSFGYSTVYHETFDNAFVAAGAITNDDSPYHQPSTITSGDENLNSVMGTVGNAAIAFDGNDEVIHRDPNTLTFAPYNQPWSLSAWVTPKNAGSNGTIIKGTLNTYSYELSLIAGQPKFTMAGMSVTGANQLGTSSASHVIVSSDGTTLSMYVNGTSVASAATSIGSNVFARTFAIIPFSSKNQSSTASSNPASNSYDGNLSTYSLTTSQTNPYWYIGNLNSTAMDNVTIYSRVTGKPLSNFTLFVSDTLPDMTDAINRIQSVTAASKWSYRMNGTVSDRVTIPLPIGTTGKYVIIMAPGENRTIALNDVQITLLPTIKIGTGFTGTIDDVRIYRRALTNDDIVRLNAMGWKQSTTTTINGFTTWQRPNTDPPLEVTTGISSMTVDNNGNFSGTTGEIELWRGALDTSSPRIVASTVSSNYSVGIADRNLNTQQIATPCGSKITLRNELPTSLWFLQHMSVLDGTYSTPTRFTGNCALAPYPELIRTNIQTNNTSTTLVYGNRYAYAGGINQILTLDVQPSTTMTQGVTTIAGTVTLLSINRAKDKLYAISTQNGGSNLTIFDIASNPLIPRQLGTLAITLPTGISIAQMGVAGSATADTYVMLADTSTPANLRSVDVSTATTPRIGAVSAIGAMDSNTTPTIYGMAVQNDIVVLAHGSNGVAIYKINLTPGTSAGASTKTTTYTAGFAQKVFINGNDLLIIDDITTPPTSPNVLRTINLISGSVSGNTATINSTLTERNSYSHTTPFNNSTTVKYRIIDVVPYRTDELMILGSATDYPNNQRIAIINTAGSSALLKSDTRINTTSPTRVITNSRNMIAMTNQGSTSNLIGYQVSDARLDTTACDILNNCTTVPSSVATAITLGQTPPVQSSIRIINPTNAFDSDSQTIHVSAETATAGIASISLLVNGQIKQTHLITGAPQKAEDEFQLTLGSGTYIITTQFTDTQTIPVTVVSAPVVTAVDLQAPQINIIDSVIGANQINNGQYIIRAQITDDVGVDNFQILNKLTKVRIPYLSKKDGTTTNLTIIYNPQLSETQIPLQITATDIVGHSTTSNRSERSGVTRDLSILIDTMPPVTDATISTTVNGKAITLSDEQTVTQTNPINVTWTKVSDASPITLHNLEYAVTTVNGSTAYTNTTTVPANSLSIAAGKFPTLTTIEASRVSAKVRLRDALGNEGATQLPMFYADTPQTPDYTLMNSTEPTYRGFVTNGCAALGEDRRPGLDNIQRFAMTWDSQAIRMNWQGADWDYDGNLFIYLDTIPGGTVQAYRPSNYTQSITNSVTLGESFITLPVNMAARSVAAGSSIASYVNDFQTALTQSQQGIRTSTIQGADYVIAINNRTNAQLLTWNGSAWVDTNSPITYQYVNERGIKQTDIRTLFSQIGYTTGNPLGVVAFATKPNSFMPWATFPTSNPVRLSLASGKFTITPLLNGYGWSNLTSGICPNTAALNPDSTQIVASLTSTPNGVFNRALADNFANTDPDAITQIISETAAMCSVLTSDPWCNTVAQYGTINNTGSALLATLAGNLASEQDPVVGNNSVVTYTLKIQNPTNKPTRRMYGIVQTYGGIWLTDSNSSGTPPVAIIGGGNYTYHNVSASGLRDYQLIQFNPIAANSNQTITFRAKIDPTKPQSSTSDRIKTSSIAKVEVRMVDDGTGTSPANFNVNRTVEWLNAAVAIDTSVPSQVLPDIQTVMTRGAFTITGSVQDQSAVSNVYLEYYTNTNSSSRTQINCGAASTGQWACPITIPSTATSITYRVRASDVYKQQSPWSGWYGATIDVTPPAFVLDPVTTSMSNASYVGGNAISLSGFITDTTSTANIKVCDQSQALCEFGSTTNPTINQSVITGTATTATEVTAQPCENTTKADYTYIPITISSGTNDQRLSSVTVDVNVTSAAANELDLWLRSPSGTLTPLMTSLRPSMVNLLARFDDNAVNATTSLTGTTEITGTVTAVKPDSTLSLLSGEAINGNWQLLACDRDENSTHSVINEWSITLNNSSSSVSTNAPWSYTLKNTSNQDNVTRKLTLWGMDAVNNTSTSRNISLNIDTVAPNFTITQLLDTMLSGSTQTAFQGTLSEGGTLSSFSANIYDSKTFVKNIPISVQSMQSQDLSRWNYLLSRTISNYTWQLPIDTNGFQSGTYTVQFIATDVAGNQRTSDAYTILVPEFTAPSITNISTANTFPNTTFTLTYKADTGKDMGDVFITVALDSAVTAPITDTTLQMWGSSGLADSTSQAKIPSGLQNTLISQLEMNNHLAAALDSNGTLTTWALQNSNTVSVTTPISDVMQLSDITQFAMGDSSNQHLLTLSNTGVITDYTPTGATSVPITDAVAIAAGTTHNLAIIKTGKLAAWGGSNANGETTIPANARMGVSQIAAGNGFSMALKSDGRLIAWGKNNLGQVTVPVSATTGIAQIAAGDNHGLALRADGVVIAWGDNSVGQSTVPISITDAIFIAANANSSAAVTSDGNVYIWGATRSVTNCCAGTSAIALNSTQILTNQVDSTQSQYYPLFPDWNVNYYRNQFNGLIPGRRYKYEITIWGFGRASYTGKFTTNQRYSTLYLPFLTNSDGATAVNTTSGK